LDHQDANTRLKDEFLPELEISLIPSKLSDNFKVDLFGLSEKFMIHLALKRILPGDYNNDVFIISSSKIMEFIVIIRDEYRKYRATVKE
jgi:hypothetical protein